MATISKGYIVESITSAGAAPLPKDITIEEPTTSTDHFQDLHAEVVAAQAAVAKTMVKPPIDINAWVTDGVVPERLRKLLEDGLDVIALAPNKDFMPETKESIQALINPSLFAYVDGISYVPDGSSLPKTLGISERPFRHQEFPLCQWLPAQFYVDKDGSVTAKTYINNVDRSQRDLYAAIELVFSLILPMFERILDKSLRERELQVIVHASDYIVQPGDPVFQGEWHMEGIPSENIVASGLYYYSSSPCLIDGGLEMGRSHGFGGTLSVGAIPTPEGRLLAFSNTIRHRVTGIENKSIDVEGRRRIIGFFLVNPEKEILSTKHVPEQQWDLKIPGIMDALDEVATATLGSPMPEEMLFEIVKWAKIGFTLEEARKYRLGLMENRKARAKLLSMRRFN